MRHKLFLKGDIMPQHNWTYEDDIVAYYLCRYGLESLLFDLNSISKKLGMPSGSMKMRVNNFKALEAREKGIVDGLINWAQLSEGVFNRYKNIPKAEHFDDVKKILY